MSSSKSSRTVDWTRCAVRFTSYLYFDVRNGKKKKKKRLGSRIPAAPSLFREFRERLETALTQFSAFHHAPHKTDGRSLPSQKDDKRIPKGTTKRTRWATPPLSSPRE